MSILERVLGDSLTRAEHRWCGEIIAARGWLLGTARRALRSMADRCAQATASRLAKNSV